MGCNVICNLYHWSDEQHQRSQQSMVTDNDQDTITIFYMSLRKRNK